MLAKYLPRVPVVVAFLAAFCRLSAEVVRVEVAQRTDLGRTGYERIVGTMFFAVDPKAARNTVIADLSLAPRRADGRVEFSSDFQILRPKESARANGAALVEISNRGSKNGLLVFHQGGTRNVDTGTDFGDEFLFRRGFTLVTVGWEFDVPEKPGMVRIKVPVAKDSGRTITGTVGATWVVDERVERVTLDDLAVYPAVESDGGERRLQVRNAAHVAGGEEVPRDQWSIAGNVVTLRGGFDPGKTYEVSYTAANPPVAGLGFAAIRDATSWLKQGSDVLAPLRYAYAFGSSQSGRFLRDYVYQGFNTDERGRAVFDGVLAHIAGAGRIDLNRRWSVPREQAVYRATSYPFADSARRDPISGLTDGVLENPRVTHVPKLFYTNTSVEYWGGGRVAALVHADPAGGTDLPLAKGTRVYFFAGTQHGPGALSAAAAKLPAPYVNPVNYWVPMRALLLAMHRWVVEDTAPPPSTYPTFRDGTLVAAAQVKFPALPRVRSPRDLQAGPRMINPLLPQGGGGGAPLPLWVPQVDDDGNELGGIRLPEIAVPLGTYTGWAFRAPMASLPGDLIPLRGLWLPFAPNPAAREAGQDPRRSQLERYANRDAFLGRTREAAERLVTQGYVLPEDVAVLVATAAGRWDWLKRQSQP